MQYFQSVREKAGKYADICRDFNYLKKIDNIDIDFGMKKFFIFGTLLLSLTYGCCNAPEWLPPIVLAPSSTFQIVIPANAGDEIKNSASALKQLLSSRIYVKSVICPEGTNRKFKSPSVFLGNSHGAKVISWNNVPVPDNTFGIIATCGGDIFIAGFSGKEKRITDSGTAEAVKRFADKYLKLQPQPDDTEENAPRPFVSKTPAIRENLILFLSPPGES